MRIGRLDPRSSVIRGGLRLALASVVIAAPFGGCSGRRYVASQATRPYPAQLGQGEIIDVQVFRDGGELIVVNATPQSFSDFDIWVNRRYMLHLDRLEAGETRRLWFGDFFDQWGETPVAGGFFRAERPTPSVLVQFQIGTEEPLLGLIAIPAEEQF
jgi:hypothetical protein